MDLCQTARVEAKSLAQTHRVIQGALGFIQFQIIVKVSRVAEQSLDLRVRLARIALTESRTGEGHGAQQEE